MVEKQNKYIFWHKQEVVAKNLDQANKFRTKIKVELESVQVKEIEEQDLIQAFGFQVETEE